MAMATKEDAPSVQLSVRVEPALIERVDALTDFVTARTGRTARRADVWREAIIIGLRELERLEKKAAER